MPHGDNIFGCPQLAQVFTDVAQIVVGIGMARIEAHGLRIMFGRCFHVPLLLIGAAEVVMCSHMIGTSATTWSSSQPLPPGGRHP